MARAAGGQGVARRIGADDFGQRQRARLDSRCAARLGSAMAASMIPPDHAPAFLAAHGWGDAQISPLAGDASFRRYFRVRDGARQAVLMDAPPPHEDPRPFIAIAEWLGGCGLSAPQILARDLGKGPLQLGSAACGERGSGYGLIS